MLGQSRSIKVNQGTRIELNKTSWEKWAEKRNKEQRWLKVAQGNQKKGAEVAQGCIIHALETHVS
eukprot:scaffold24582_cov74-Cyclotella_meneghiniana.AAC.1